MAAINDENDAELCADAFGTGEYLHDLFRPGAGRNVIVGGFDCHDHIAHASSDEICFVASAAQLLYDIHRRICLNIYLKSCIYSGYYLSVLRLAMTSYYKLFV